MINTLQAGRFFAAMAVVVHHASISVKALVDTPPAAVGAVLNYGYLGVDFFFVLSGFIIHYTITRTPRPAVQFAYDRLTRIMLPYWPIAIVLALAYTAIPTLSGSERSWSWLSTVTLFPTSLPPALSVAWTLQHELAFYLIYAALFFSGRVVAGLAIWTAAIVAAWFVGLPDVPLLRVLLAPINIEFIAGIVAAAVFMRDRYISGAISVCLAAGFMLLFLATGAARTESWLFGFAIVALLPWLCALEARGTFSVPDWLTLGGAASYAIYLVHNPLLSLTSRVLARIDLTWPSALILSTIICAAAGVAYYFAWERPIMRMRKRAHRRPVPVSG